MLKDFAQRSLNGRKVLHVDSRRRSKPCDRPGLVQLEYEVVGPKARNVTRKVPTRKRIVKIVGQKDRIQAGRPPDVVVPGWPVQFVICTIVKSIDRFITNVLAPIV